MTVISATISAIMKRSFNSERANPSPTNRRRRSLVHTTEPEREKKNVPVDSYSLAAFSGDLAPRLRVINNEGINDTLPSEGRSRYRRRAEGV